MKKFAVKILILALPFIALLTAELFILPVDFFNFRAWEALTNYKPNAVLTGPFYPAMKLEKTEEGDLGHHTKFAVKKRVEWITDAYGYRNREDSGHFDAVIVGDSFCAGASLTQDDTLANVLAGKNGMKLYNMSPANLNYFVRDERFKNDPPEWVIFECSEMTIRELAWVIDPPDPGGWNQTGIKSKNLAVKAAVLYDRLFKLSMLKWIRASLYRLLSFDKPREFQGIFFSAGRKANRPVPEEEIERQAQLIGTYQAVCRKRSIKMIFLIVPNKENIYYNLIGTPKPVYLDRLDEALAKKRVVYLDLTGSFRKEYSGKTDVFQRDDSHWNRHGVEVAAEQLADLIRIVNSAGASPRMNIH
jgi:hypothetical protein